MLLKVLFLLVYFLLVFVCVRLFEFYLTSLVGGVGRLPIGLLDLLANSRIYSQYERRSEKKTDDECASANDQHLRSSEENNIVEFTSYGDMIENVEDTKASVWVVKVYGVQHKSHTIKIGNWKKLAKKLKHYGIKTAEYKCGNDPWLCIKFKITSSTFILSMPKGSKPKGNVAFHVYEPDAIISTENTESMMFNWIQKRLYPKVKTVHSFSELNQKPVTRNKHTSSLPSLAFVYQSDKHVPPLTLTALSVKFTGRIKFYMLKTHDETQYGNVFAMNKFTTYSYGKHKGEDFNYTCMELFLRTLHPEVNDIFIVSVVLLNMACWLELFLQKGGPLRRLLYYIWGFTMTNVLLVSVWLPIIQLLYMPQIQPLIDICLKRLQQMMFTNIAAIIRQDFLQLSQHSHIVFIGFVCYGIFIGYLHYKLRNEQQQTNISLFTLFDEDIREVNEMFHSMLTYITPSLRIYRFEERIERILSRLSTPDLWLHSMQSTDFIQELPRWKYCTKAISEVESIEFHSDSEVNTDCELSPPFEERNMCMKCISKELETIPSLVLLTGECVICLDKYKCQDTVTGLPCGHNFHKNCIEPWLLLGNGSRCPVCRWPADIIKGKYEVVDITE